MVALACLVLFDFLRGKTGGAGLAAGVAVGRGWTTSFGFVSSPIPNNLYIYIFIFVFLCGLCI